MGQNRVNTGGVLALLLAFVACAGPELDAAGQQARWHSSQGVVYMDQHNYVRGREQFETAVRLDPEYATAHANLGIACYSLGKYDSARVSLETALRIDPEHLHASYTLGLIEHAQGRDYGRALDLFRRVARADDDDPLVLYYLGRTHSKTGAADSAVSAFRRAIALDANNVSAHYALAQELRQLGELEAWRATLETFNRLSQAGLEGVSSSYQGQGPYAEALAEGDFARPGDDGIGPLRFAAAGRLVGLAAQLSYLAAVDSDGDGDTDVLLGEAGSAAMPRLYLHDAGGLQPAGHWEITGVGGDEPRGVALADVDDDGDLDAAWWGTRLGVVLRQGDGGPLVAVADLPTAAATAAVFGDIDHDGDADLIATGPDIVLWANDGTGRFTDATAMARLQVSAHTAVLTDFDDDRDIDVLALGASAALFTNNRDGTFTDVAGDRGLRLAGGDAVAVADWAADGRMDILVATADGAQLFANDGARFTAHPVTAPPGVTGLHPADLDNDGDLDLVWQGVSGIQIAVNVDGQLQAPAASLGRGLALVLDVDDDGRLDVLADGELHLNQSDAGAWLEIDLAGLNSNPDAFGAKVEVKTTHGQMKRELRGGGTDPVVLHFGLGAADSVEFVRVLWPSGVRQTELATGANQRLTLTEVDRKGTSCPILYAWDGSGFGFVSDFLGGAIIGYLTAPGQYYTPDTDEYLPLRNLAPRNGRYVLQVGNQLEETIYLDAAELVAVDHPSGTVVVPNERLLSAPPYAGFRPYVLTETRPLRGALTGDGHDVSEQLRYADDDWVADFGHRDIHGYAEEHTLTLDLGDLRGWTDPVLLAHGWVDYAHSSSNWAAAQRQLELMPPRLEADDGSGWRRVSDDMGTPAGLPKQMLVDLADVFAPDTRRARLRITTSVAVYWDQFLLGRAAPDRSRHVHRQPFSEADLHWRGYPEHESIGGTFAFRYHYDRLQTEAAWGTHAGGYTRLGDVVDLVTDVDDRFAIMFHGDELTLSVAADAFPPLAEGWQRTFLFYADGFGKDMDYHSAHSLTVEPLPFHGMSSYPYPSHERYPTSAQHVRYVLDYNTRRVKGYFR